MSSRITLANRTRSLRLPRLTVLSLAAWAVLISFQAPQAVAQNASLDQAMAIQAKQRDAKYDRPTAAELKNCKIDKSTTPPGFIVTDASGRVLRQFFDNNKDGKLDQWSYFQNGIEVYRDLDTDFDRKTDQYRWLGNGGTRWGLDPDEDGTIDSWKVISAEEVAYEAFMAVSTRDQQRFQRLLLTPQEFAALKFGASTATRIKTRWQAAKAGFGKAVAGPLKMPKGATYVQWGNGRPAMCAAGTDGNANDVVCFDHASGVYQAGKEFGQIAIGTIIKVGDAWRLVELPELVSEGKPIDNGGVLFPLPGLGDLAGDLPDTGNEPPSQLAKLYEQLDSVDAQLDKATKGSDIAKLFGQKAAVMQKIYFESEPKNRRNWLENIADSVSSAFQDEKYPTGLDFLESFGKRLRANKITDGVDYVQFRSVYAKYGLAMKIRDSKGRDKAEQELLTDVEDFVDRYPKSKFAPEGMFQLALNAEISERDADRAVSWYKKIIASFPGTVDAQRAKGAIMRLTGIGKPLRLQSQTAQGGKFSTADPKLRGKLVILHYYENWCADGFDDIARLAAKFKDQVVFVGCNIDSTTQDFKGFMAKNRNVTWLQLHEPGGVEKSPLAYQLGVSTLPLVMMLDAKGNLVEANMAFGDLEREIQRELKRAKQAKR